MENNSARSTQDDGYRLIGKFAAHVHPHVRTDSGFEYRTASERAAESWPSKPDSEQVTRRVHFALCAACAVLLRPR